MAHPKQFTDIIGSGRSLIQATVDRVDGYVPRENIYVITGKAYKELATAQLAELPLTNIIGEPSGRNTAPAIGLACVLLQRSDPQAVVAFLPADHVVQDLEKFRAALTSAQEAARAGYLVTLGIKPQSPHTGYGYIKRNHQIGVMNGLPVFEVAQFLEKPDRETAEKFLQDDGYYWNGGIFVTRVDTMLNEMAWQLPALYANLQKIKAALGTDKEKHVLADTWSEMPSISIDYGVMEHAQKVAVVPLDAGWNDVGSWSALEEVVPKDDDGNCLIGGENLGIDVSGSIVAGNKRFIALIGVEDLVVVDTDDALLIGRKSEMQKVKDVVKRLREMGRHDLL
jgi:mannose-1-phosphate guanylyltransferase